MLYFVSIPDFRSLMICSVLKCSVALWHFGKIEAFWCAAEGWLQVAEAVTEWKRSEATAGRSTYQNWNVLGPLLLHSGDAAQTGVPAFTLWHSATNHFPSVLLFWVWEDKIFPQSQKNFKKLKSNQLPSPAAVMPQSCRSHLPVWDTAYKGALLTFMFAR